MLLTKVPPPPDKEAAELREFLTGLSVPIVQAGVPELKALKKAASAAQIANQTAARASQAYAAAGKEIL